MIDKDLNKILNVDCIEYIKTLPAQSIDCICTDPPYLYLRHKLDKRFDENIFFNECKRILKDNGFIILFGRGTSFYRWNTMLADLGFSFKEEIIWNKRYTSSPMIRVNRIHETISIHSKNNTPLNDIRIPYEEIKQDDLFSIVTDIKRLASGIKNKEADAMDKYLCKGEIDYIDSEKPRGNGITVNSSLKGRSRAVATLKTIIEGGKIKSIIEAKREHYKKDHPTQKPVSLIKNLLSLCTKENDIVLEPFAGSASTAIAAKELNCSYIACEIDKDYYEAAKTRLDGIRNLFDL